MESISLQGASQLNPIRQEIPPPPPQAEDVQEFQKLYWNEPKDPGMDPIFKLALSAEIEPVSPSAFSKVMEKMMENTNRFEDLKDSIQDRLRAGMEVSLEERADLVMLFQETKLQLELFQSFSKKTEEGLKSLITGQ